MTLKGNICLCICLMCASFTCLTYFNFYIIDKGMFVCSKERFNLQGIQLNSEQEFKFQLWVAMSLWAIEIEGKLIVDHKNKIHLNGNFIETWSPVYTNNLYRIPWSILEKFKWSGNYSNVCHLITNSMLLLQCAYIVFYGFDC